MRIIAPTESLEIDACAYPTASRDSIILEAGIIRTVIGERKEAVDVNVSEHTIMHAGREHLVKVSPTRIVIVITRAPIQEFSPQPTS